MGKKLTSLIVVIMCICFFLGSTAKILIPTMAPQNPEFIHYMHLVQQGLQPPVYEEGFPLGEIPSPVDMSHIRGYQPNQVRDSIFPSTFSLLLFLKLTAVRNQAACGACWTFATMAVIESLLLPGLTRDYSEQHLNANHGFAWAECAGGNTTLAMAYLLFWYLFLEATYPYPYAPMDAAQGNGVAHVQAFRHVPARTGFTDNNNLKYFIQKYGATYISYYASGTYYNATNSAFYNNVNTTTNHAVAAVGWDDNFAASKFNTTPPGNGAWLVRNSWGTGYGTNGYFWLSYYDTSFVNRISIHQVENVNNYTTNYQYDRYGQISSVGYGSTTCWGANIYTATDSKPIRAVGFYLPDVSSTFEVRVYTGVTAGQPTSGTLGCTVTGSRDYAGFYTIELPCPVNVAQGTRFSAVVKVVNNTSTFPQAFEYPIAGYCASAASNPGESYLSSNGSSWTDITTYGGIYAEANVCIKAYSGTVPKEELLGTWTGQGVYCKNPYTGAWDYMATPASKTACGDLDGDGLDDLVGIWAGQGGVWVKYSSSGQWALLSTTADWIAIGDMNGDGKDDLVGSWSGQGVYYKDTNLGDWVYLSTPASQIVAGDLDNDGTDDLIGIWAGQGGVWVKYSANSTWAYLSTSATWIAAGDMNGDGWDDLLGTWDGQGVYYKNSNGGTWMYQGTPATQIATGDLDGDGIADLIGIWAGQGGVWLKKSSDGQWELLSTTANWIGAGKMRFPTSAPIPRSATSSIINEGIPMEGPNLNGNFKDLRQFGPGGSQFNPRMTINPIPGSVIDETKQEKTGSAQVGRNIKK